MQDAHKRLDGAYLQVCVKDRGIMGQGIFLGEAYLPLQEISEENMDRTLQSLPQLQLPLTRPQDHGKIFLYIKKICMFQFVNFRIWSDICSGFKNIWSSCQRILEKRTEKTLKFSFLWIIILWSCYYLPVLPCYLIQTSAIFSFNKPQYLNWNINSWLKSEVARNVSGTEALLSASNPPLWV